MAFVHGAQRVAGRRLIEHTFLPQSHLITEPASADPASDGVIPAHCDEEASIRAASRSCNDFHHTGKLDQTLGCLTL